MRRRPTCAQSHVALQQSRRDQRRLPTQRHRRTRALSVPTNVTTTKTNAHPTKQNPIEQVLKTPEVLRVYIGSFWDQPLMYDQLQPLFEKEEADLMHDLKELPRRSAVRKINDLVKVRELVLLFEPT